MALPNRHVAIGSMLGQLCFVLFPTKTVAVAVGAVLGFLSHTPADLVFNECWYRNRWQTAVLGIVCGTALVVNFIFMLKLFGPLVALILAIVPLIPDIVDDIIMRMLLHKPAYFKCHYRADGNYWEPWLVLESFWTTLFLEVSFSVLATLFLISYL